jgi:hypothetical protein
MHLVDEQIQLRILPRIAAFAQALLQLIPVGGGPPMGLRTPR